MLQNRLEYSNLDPQVSENKSLSICLWRQCGKQGPYHLFWEVETIQLGLCIQLVLLRG